MIPKFIDQTQKVDDSDRLWKRLNRHVILYMLTMFRAFLMLAAEPWQQALEPVYNVCTQTEISMLDLLSMHSQRLERCRSGDPVDPSKS